MAGEILLSELQKGNKVCTELEKILEEMDTSREIKATWGHSLDLLELQIELSREAGWIASNSTIARRTYLMDIIIRIYGRGCHLASEISYLLKGGYPDGAEARSRTLYELEMIALFISERGEDIAKRYYLYDAVERRRFCKFIIADFENLNRSLSPEEEKIYAKAKADFDFANQNVEVCIKHFGPNFKEKYGWASDILEKKNPNFTDIERAVKDRGSRIPYKSANFAIHGGPRALFCRRGLPDPESVLVGPSRYGFRDVINNTAVSLEALTGVLIAHCDKETIRAVYDFQYNLTAEIMKASKKAEEELGPLKRKS